MNEQLSSVIFLFVVSCLTYFEQKRFENLFTPFTITAWPFVVITLLVNFILNDLDFPYITERVNYFILFNLLLIWFSGFVMFHYISPKENYFQFTKLFIPLYKYRGIFIIIAIGIFIITYFRVTNIIASKGGWWYLGVDEFADEIQHGAIAHLIMYSKVGFLIIFLLYLNHRKNIYYYFTLFLFALTIFVIQNKYHLMMILIMAFFFENLQIKIKKQFISILRISSFLFILFVIYFVVVIIGWQKTSYDFTELSDHIFKMFINYLVSGPIVLDTWLEFPGVKPSWTPFMHLIDLKNLLYGDPERLNQVHNLSMGFKEIIPGFSSNVGTSFGVYYLIGGFEFCFFITIIISIISYYFYYKSIKSRNMVIIYFNIFFLTIGMLSFFVQFFTLISIYEMAFLFLVTYYLMNLFSGISNSLSYPKQIY